MSGAPKIKPSDSERLTSRRRGGQRLTREEVKVIKAGRKKLRKEMRAKGIKSKREFEVTAASLGLYFDRPGKLFFWWLHGRGLLALLLAGAAIVTLLTLMSFITQMKGHFTINMSDGMFREGFALSESKDFKNPSSVLFAMPAVEVPCISISWLDPDVDTAYEGAHNKDYFAYTYYLRNEGQNTVDYTWRIVINSESKALSNAVWMMVFVDGEMTFYAHADENGQAEVLPSRDVEDAGYTNLPLMDQCLDPEKQYEAVGKRGDHTYYRVVPEKFLSDSLVATGTLEGVAPMDVHRYTVVLWLEGDDPDCTNDLIGGHVGMNMQFNLAGETAGEGGSQGSAVDWFENIWGGLKWWGKE